MEKENKSNESIKNVTIGIIGVIALVITTVGITYAVWTSNASQVTQNAITVGCVNVTLADESDDITISEAYPISDGQGKQLKPYKFTVKNNCKFSATYKVTLEKLSGSNLDPKYVKVLLSNQGEATTNLEAKALITSNYPSSEPYVTAGATAGFQLLTNQTLEASATKAYDLRLWLDTSAPSSIGNQVFNSKIVVKAVPTNQK